jgi:hypothetical protein
MGEFLLAQLILGRAWEVYPAGAFSPPILSGSKRMRRYGMLASVFVLLLSGLVALLSGPAGASAQPAIAAPARTASEAPARCYHLRIKFWTNSTWSKLENFNPDGILTLRLSGVAGEQTTVRIKPEELYLAQPTPGETIAITVDYALSPRVVGNVVRFRLTKAGSDWSRAEVFGVNGDREWFLQRLESPTHSGNVVVNLNLAALRGVPPEQREPPGRALPRMVWAYYYPWYTDKTWSKPTLNDRPLELYSSDDARVIARQIDQAQSVGIDGFISSWWGPGDKTDTNLKSLLTVAREKGFRIALFLETLKDGHPRSEEEMVRWLSYAIRTYRDSPALMKVNGKPVIFLFASQTVPVMMFRRIVVQLREQGLDACFIADAFGLDKLGLCDGVHRYNLGGVRNLESDERRTSQLVRNAWMLNAAPRDWVFAATVQPGWDDRHIPGRKGNFQDRQDGAYMRRSFEAAIAGNPDWICISTWNEWFENSEIEPGQRYGDRYLEITREYTRRWKESGDRREPLLPLQQQGGR